MRTLRDLFVQKTLVLASEHERDGAGLGEREDIRGTIARRLHVLTVKSFARRRAYYGHAIRHRFLESRELLAVVDEIGRMNGEAAAFLPIVLQIGRGETQMVNAHVGHGAAGRADVAGVERSDKNHTNII